MYSSDYLAQKEANAALAQTHLQDIASFQSMIQHSIDHTVTYENIVPAQQSADGHYPTVQVFSGSCIPVIMKTVKEYPSQRVTVLSNGNYKEPGGSFLTGGITQEDELCHASTLYPVLQANQRFYDRNRVALHRSLYTNRALFIPDVRFEQEGDVALCSVLSCSAPNRKIALSYNHATEEENTQVLAERIHYALRVADAQGTDHLICGAFGCGLCGQLPSQVAAVFNTELSSGAYHFKTVQFAIPHGSNPRFNAYTFFKSEFHA